jgi:hypothetical protein
MKSRMLLVTIGALAAIAGTAVHADEANASQYRIQFQGARSRDEVRAEAATVTANHSTEPAGSRVAAPLQSSLDSKVVRAQAAEAVRLGRITRGEAGPI